MLNPEPIKACIKCQRPLGDETRQLRIPVCHEHRKCYKCATPVDNTVEIQYCLDHNLAITHARCLTVDKSTDIDEHLLNLSRLIFYPNPQIPRPIAAQATGNVLQSLDTFLSHDHILHIVSQAQAIAAAGTLMLQKHHRKFSIELQERDALKLKEAEEYRQNQKPEVKQAKKAKAKEESAAEKTISLFMQMGMSREQALAQLEAVKAAKKDMV